MEKEQSQNPENNTLDDKDNNVEASPEINNQDTEKQDIKEEPEEKSSEEKILELEDKLARTFAEMENQRRRFEKEKDEAFEYGGFSFAKEALSLTLIHI